MPKRKSCKKGYSRNRSTGRCRKNSKSRSKRSRRNTSKRSKRKSMARRRSPVKEFKEYEVAVEYYSPPNFKKSKYGNLIMNLESVMDEDENGINMYYHLARVKALNRPNLLKYLNGIGNLKRIIAIDNI
jgi:hypothetical protein